MSLNTIILIILLIPLGLWLREETYKAPHRKKDLRGWIGVIVEEALGIIDKVKRKLNNRKYE